MTELMSNLFVGNIQDIENLSDDEWAFVHATQTYHYQVFGWNRTNNKPDKLHPNYIIFNSENHLSLNWVDGAAYLYKWSGPGTFNETLDFIDLWLKKRKVLIHCDQGLSRSPTLCLLFLAKRANKIPHISFEEANIEFGKLYSNYNPSGIAQYVSENWDEIQ